MCIRDSGKHEELLEECGLNAEGIREAIARRLEQLGYPGLTATR